MVFLVSLGFVSQPGSAVVRCLEFVAVAFVVVQLDWQYLALLLERFGSLLRLVLMLALP